MRKSSLFMRSPPSASFLRGEQLGFSRWREDCRNVLCALRPVPLEEPRDTEHKAIVNLILQLLIPPLVRLVRTLVHSLRMARQPFAIFAGAEPLAKFPLPRVRPPMWCKILRRVHGPVTLPALEAAHSVQDAATASALAIWTSRAMSIIFPRCVNKLSNIMEYISDTWIRCSWKYN